MNRQPLIILAGATAVGKTDLSLWLAREVDGEIISADSMQVYKGFDIGTAKISVQEMQGIPHHLIDICEPEAEYNVFTFRKQASEAMKEIHSRGKIPILVGGTGFYIQSVLYDIDFTQTETDKELRAQLMELAASKGPSYLHGLLKEADPEAAAQIHENNVRRVIRALEFYRETGSKISGHNEEQKKKESPYAFAYFVLNRERSCIYDRIGRRVDQMLAQGLAEEVQGLLSQGVSPHCQAMQGLGYKEMLLYLQGELTLAEAADLLKKNTRHFAKRQITWFKREKDAIWLNYEDYKDLLQMQEAILQILKEKNIVSLS